ncbi:MAG: ribonuclease E/G, partial [Pseudorhodoplanes sp.]
ARIQLGRISHFGLMEMSRQRLRSGVLEGSTSQCPHCQGTGIIRSTESVALAVLRALEDALMAGARTSLVATTTSSVALYILNNKRHFINEMETRHGIFVTVQASDKLQGANFLIEKGHAAPVATRRPDRAAVNMDWGFTGEAPDGEADEAEGADEDVSARGSSEPRGRDEGRDGAGGRRRRRRRGRRGGEGRGEQRGDSRRDEGAQQPYDDDYADDHEAPPVEAGGGHDAGEEFGEDDAHAHDGDADQEARGGEGRPRERSGHEEGGRRRRRGRRGGRRGRDRGRNNDEVAVAEGAIDLEEEADNSERDTAPDIVVTEAEGAETGEQTPAREPRRRASQPRDDESRPPRPRRTEKEAPAAADAAAAAPEAVVPAPVSEQPAPVEEDTVLARVRARQASSAEPKLERVVVSPDQTGSRDAASEEPVRRGWWQRRLGG